jgi:drug/metabolite transporter (DMT)-like permease
MPTYQALILSVISMIVSGVVWFVAVKPIRELGNVRALFLFELAGIPMFLIFIPFRPHVVVPPTFNLIFLVGAFEALIMLFLFHANKIGEAAIVNPVSKAAFLFTTILAIIFLHEIPNTFGFLGLIGVLAGVTLISLNIGLLRKTKSVQLFNGVPHALVFAIGDGTYFLWVSILARQNGWFYTALGIRIAISIVMLAILVFKKNNIWQVFKNVPWKWMLPAALGDVIAFSFYNIAVSGYQVAYVTIITSASVLVTVTLAVIFLKEKLRLYQIFGLALVVLGLVALQF